MSNYSTVQHFPPVFVSTHHVAMAAFHHSLDSQRPSALQPLRIYPQYLDIRQPTFAPPPVLMHKCQHPGCDRQFNRKYTLAEHEKTHTGEKPHVCPVRTCNKSFSTSGNLSRHKRLHGYIEPLPCPVAGCVCTFTSNNKLAKHMRFHFGSDDVKVCVVSGCGKTFSTTGNLNRHLKAAHSTLELTNASHIFDLRRSVSARTPCPTRTSLSPKQQRGRGGGYFEPDAIRTNGRVCFASTTQPDASWGTDELDALAGLFDVGEGVLQLPESAVPADVDMFRNSLHFEHK